MRDLRLLFRYSYYDLSSSEHFVLYIISVLRSLFFE